MAPIIDVTSGIVRNLLKTTYYLRIPRKDKVGKTVPLRHDRDGQTIPLPPNVDVELFWKDFDAIEEQLIALNRDNIVRIIKRPTHSSGVGTDNLDIEKDSVTVVSDALFLNFHGNVDVTNEGANRAGVTVRANNQGREVFFTAGDWNEHTLEIIPTGVPVIGQIGPHQLPVSGKQYDVAPFKILSVDDRRPIDLDTFVNISTGVISLKKAPAIPDFAGLVMLTMIL